MASGGLPELASGAFGTSCPGKIVGTAVFNNANLAFEAYVLRSQEMASGGLPGLASGAFGTSCPGKIVGTAVFNNANLVFEPYVLR